MDTNTMNVTIADTLESTSNAKGNAKGETLYSKMTTAIKARVNAVLSSVNTASTAGTMKNAAAVETTYSDASKALKVIGDAVLLYALCYVAKNVSKGETSKDNLLVARRACKSAYGQDVKLANGDKVAGANDACKRVRNVIDGLAKDVTEYGIPPIDKWLKEHEGLTSDELSKAIRKSFSEWKKALKDAAKKVADEKEQALKDAHQKAQIEAVMQATGKTFEEIAQLLNV